MSLAAWIDAYQRAWLSNDPGDIGALFTDDAEYFTAPSREPWRGREAIVDGWREIADQPGDFTFVWQTLVDTTDLGVITGRTVYTNGDDYDNLWVIRFGDDGRCTEFTEWYMRREGSA